MGGITSLASTAIQALGAADALLGVAGNYKDRTGEREYANLKAQSDLSLRNAQEQAALQREQIRLSAEQTETNRRAALRRAMARQRALYGASGTGSGGGSAQAVLLGMFEESEEELQQRMALDALKTAGIDQGMAQQQRINTLQLTQLRERDKIKSLRGTIGSAKDLGTIIF